MTRLPRPKPAGAAVAILVVLCFVVPCVVVLCATVPGFASGVANTAGAPPCGTSQPAQPAQPAEPAQSAEPARYDHVVWIWFENKARGQVIGNADAPYTSKLTRQCATAPRYVGIRRPSLPNYIAATSGNTQGITDSRDPAAHVIVSDNLFRQVRAAGGTALSYQESMAAPCMLTSDGRYAVRHNPAAYYQGGDDRAACERDDVPLGTRRAGALHDAVATDTLPTFAFITPNLCNDTHDCDVATGDRWLRSWLPRLLATPSYRSGRTVIFLMWDEARVDEGGDESGVDGSGAGATIFDPIPFVVLAASIDPGTVVRGAVDHYDALRTTQTVLGLTPLLGHAADAQDLAARLGLSPRASG